MNRVLLGLIDSGADLSAIPQSLAIALGLNLEGETIDSEGINGLVKAIETKMGMIIEKDHEKYKFQLPV